MADQGSAARESLTRESARTNPIREAAGELPLDSVRNCCCRQLLQLLGGGCRELAASCGGPRENERTELPPSRGAAALLPAPRSPPPALRTPRSPDRDAGSLQLGPLIPRSTQVACSVRRFGTGLRVNLRCMPKNVVSNSKDPVGHHSGVELSRSQPLWYLTPRQSMRGFASCRTAYPVTQRKTVLCVGFG